MHVECQRIAKPDAILQGCQQCGSDAIHAREDMNAFYKKQEKKAVYRLSYRVRKDSNIVEVKYFCRTHLKEYIYGTAFVCNITIPGGLQFLNKLRKERRIR